MDEALKLNSKQWVIYKKCQIMMILIEFWDFQIPEKIFK